MAEEIQNAPITVPRAIMTGIFINGSLGFGMMLTMLFRSGDIDEALKANPSFPFIAIFYNAVQSVSGAATMAAFVMILSTCCAVGTLASSSRVFWAFSRDRGLPGWSALSQVSSCQAGQKKLKIKKISRSAPGPRSLSTLLPPPPPSPASSRSSISAPPQLSTV